MNKSKWLNPALLKWLLIAGGIAFLLITFGRTLNTALKKLFVFVGLADSEEEKAVEAAQVQAASPASPWSPNYYKTLGGAPMPITTADGIANKIKNSLGWWRIFGDDEQTIYAQFRLLQSKAQVSYLAERFTILTGEDLFKKLYPNEWWNSYGLDEKEMKIVIDIVNGLPNK